MGLSATARNNSRRRKPNKGGPTATAPAAPGIALTSLGWAGWSAVAQAADGYAVPAATFGAKGVGLSL
jgi:hypothetical protein